MLKNNLIENGFQFINADQYMDAKNSSSLHDLKKAFDLDLEEDVGCCFRRRAYLKLQWDRKNNQISLPEKQGYFQTADSNAVDGGKIRQFKIMNREILNLEIIKTMLAKDLAMIQRYPLLKQYETLTIGMHFIRYIVNQDGASFSSPAWLHKDDEPLVFVHLVGLSKNALGGDNLIADNDKKIIHVIRLENDMDTLVVNNDVYHAVTPIGSKSGNSMRDVILITVEPDNTQMASLDEMVA